MRLIFLFAFTLIYEVGFTQLHDKTWICGSYGGKVVFENGQIDTMSFSPKVYALSQWACISDKEGNFQFFTEGVNVYSANGTFMTNGNELVNPAINAAFPIGLTDDQNVIVLPKNDYEYYIICQSQSDFEYNRYPWWFTDRLYYSVVDMNFGGGLGWVKDKRIEIPTVQCMDGKMTACQHANGRDWWLVQRRYSSNTYRIYLVTPDTFAFIREQSIGPASDEPDSEGQSAFSPDGSKYATITGWSPLIVLDFDRCEGLFSNPITINVPLDTFVFYGQTKVSGGGGNGLCFSHSNRYLYVNTIYFLRQYDLTMNPVDSSEQVIFFWSDSNEYRGHFNQEHLGPDGKIYIANYHGFTSALHVIHEPDSAGLACQFEKWGQPIATINASKVPNWVHFRMGPLVGSGCDTITAIADVTEKEKHINLYPNPATDFVVVDYGFTDWSKGDVALEIVNSIGQVVYQRILPRYSGIHQVDVREYAMGVYTATIKQNGAVVAVGRFVKE